MKDEFCPDCGAKAKERRSLEDIIEQKLLDKRILILHGETGENTCNLACKELVYLGSVSKEPIKVILNSVGGEVYHALLIYNTLTSLRKEGIRITIEVRGLAASMGLIILQAGSERLTTKYTRFLMHEITTWAFGKASQVEEEAKEAKKVNDMLYEIISERTGKSIKVIAKKCKKKDVWMNADEALKYGLIDKIV